MFQPGLCLFLNGAVAHPESPFKIGIHRSSVPARFNHCHPRKWTITRFSSQSLPHLEVVIYSPAHSCWPRRRDAANNFADNCREGGGVHWHQGVAVRYEGTRRGWYALARRNKRNLWEQIRSVSNCITPRLSLLKKERMSELETWHQRRISPFRCLSFFFLKGHNMFLLERRKESSLSLTQLLQRKKQNAHREIKADHSPWD